MITLAEYAQTQQDKTDVSLLVDELQKNSILLDALIFDDTVVPTGGSSFPYIYHRKTQTSGAAFRTVGDIYEASDAKTEPVTTEVKILGGKYTIDRAIAKASKNAFIDQVDFQSTEKVNAVIATFCNAVINGDSAVDAKSFDGLNKILAGTTTEYTSESDLSTAALVTANYQTFLDEVDGVIAEMDKAPDFIFGNSKSITKFKAALQRAGQYQTTVDSRGRSITKYGDISLVDLGARPNSSDPVVAIDAIEGTTDLYFVRIGQDGFHGITLANGNMMDIVTPSFENLAATQGDGLVEAYLGVVLKSTKAAAVLRGIKVK